MTGQHRDPAESGLGPMLGGRDAWSSTDPNPKLETVPSWFADAACRGMPSEVFFPERGASLAPARRICASCEVRSQCKDHAVTTREAFGVWAGLSERQRRRLRATGVRRRPINHGTQGGYQTHLRWGEPACDECQEAQRRHHREWRQGRTG